MEPVGDTVWVIAGGYIPSTTSGDGQVRETHETASVINASDADAHLEITIFFSDREPVGPYLVTVPARRTLHQRFNDLDDPEPVPRDTDYASIITSDLPVVVQHTRLDSRQPELATLSTMAWCP